MLCILNFPWFISQFLCQPHEVGITIIPMLHRKKLRVNTSPKFMKLVYGRVRFCPLITNAALSPSGRYVIISIYIMECIWVLYLFSIKQQLNNWKKSFFFCFFPFCTFKITVFYGECNSKIFFANHTSFIFLCTIWILTPDSLSEQTRKRMVWPVSLVNSCPFPKFMNLSLPVCLYDLFSVQCQVL